jgi:hypothetical protein
MTYKGKYKVKNKDKYSGASDNVIYRSLWERNVFRWCDENKSIKSWSSEEVVVPYLFEVDKKYHRYFVDLKITFDTDKTILVEIKPAKELSPPKGSRRTRQYISEGMTYVKNQNKWKAAKEYALDRGWEFHIWTEKELEAMNILPKSTKPLPPFSRKKTNEKSR